MPKLRCEDIEATTATQVRVKLDRDVIDLYQQDLEDGAVFPAVDVFNQGGGDKRYILADGFHRLLAHINAGVEEIDVKVHKGGMVEALIYALGANGKHGLRRSNLDKRHAVEMALKDPTISKMSRQEIADVCGVTKRTVQRIANQAVTEPDEPEPAKKNKQKPEAANDSHKRQTRTPPTQAEIEREELREAIAIIKGFPYGGDGVVNLDLNDDDCDGLAYVSEWCGQGVIAINGES